MSGNMINIMLHTPEKDMLVTVRQHDCIQVLQNYYKSKKTTLLVHQSKVLFTKFTFSFFKINDGDHIYALPQNVATQFYKFSKNNEVDAATKTLNQLSKIQNSPISPESCMEKVRLRDLQKNKTNQFQFQKLAQALQLK